MDLTRRSVLASGVVGTATTLATVAPHATARPSARPGRRPNIVVVLADDLGYGALGAYGQQVIRTPHLDRLAAEGIAFTQGYSGAAVCAPSRTTLLTGLHAGHSRVRGNTQRGTGVEPELEPGDVTFAEVLRAAGYRTGLFGKWGFGPDDLVEPTPLGVTCEAPLPVAPGNGIRPPAPTGDFHVANRGHRSHPLRKGFERFTGLVTTAHAFQYWPDYLWRGDRRSRLPGNAGEERGTYAPEVYLEEALRFIDEHRDEEFCLVLAAQLVHFPIQVPDTSAYDDEVGWTQDMKGYAAQHTLLDEHVGRIVERLERHGLADDTLLVFTGDNGPTPNEHLLVGGSACSDVLTTSPDSAGADYLWETNGGLRAGKHSLYEGGVRVPLIVWGPGVVRRDAATVADRVWGSVDLLPTLADIAGVTPPSDVDGVSVRDWITGERRGRVVHPPMYFERPPANDQNTDGGPPSPLVYTTALRWGRFKAVRHAPGTDPLVDDALARFELYDLEADPAETTDVSTLHPDVVARFQRRMRRSHSPEPIARSPYRPRRTGGELRWRQRPRRGADTPRRSSPAPHQEFSSS